jgi:SAM-dependent methyltransferase
LRAVADPAGVKRRVRDFWEREPCGTPIATAPAGTLEYFRQIEEYRYRTEPCIPDFARFPSAFDRRVLEIGIGAATDFINFARAGAQITGVDLTQAAVDLANQRLALEGLPGMALRADAEQLPFADESFDLVYSWGVLHHTPNTQRAIDEVRRVLAPGGEARVMLYSRRSWRAAGYWIKYAALRGRPWRSLRDVIAHHVESEGTKAYTRGELRRLFNAFGSVRLVSFLTAHDVKVGGPLARLSGDRFGWFVGVEARR